MRALLSTIGSRGDVQPLVALGVQLKALGHEAELCVPPDFRAWIEGLGLSVTPLGPEVQSTGKAKPNASVPSPEQRQKMVDDSVIEQFARLGAAARGCDVMLGASGLQIAGPSVAEQLGLPYVFVAYCAAVLPSPHHAPPVLSMLGDQPTQDYAALWERDKARFDSLFGPILNQQRRALGLAPVSDVRGHVFTERPWLAADATLDPWPETEGYVVEQPGAFILPDARPLSEELEAFLNAGEPPVYFGFGSIRAPERLSQVMIESARALGRRVIVLRGWADLSLIDDAKDCLAIGEVNHQLLLPRVAAVVHHGGAGTTTASARARVPQVLIPQLYDQHHWAQRIEQLGIGAAHASGSPTTESLTRALSRALQPECVARARELGQRVRSDGAERAAQRLLASVRSRS